MSSLTFIFYLKQQLVQNKPAMKLKFNYMYFELFLKKYI